MGLRKTGSTALQTFLFDNRKALPAAGFTTPRLIDANHGAFLDALFHPDRDFVAASLTARNRPGFLADLPGWRAAFDGAMAEAAEAGLDMMVSAERAPLLREAGLSALRTAAASRFDHVVALALVRPVASYVESAAQQAIRLGATLDRLSATPPTPNYRAHIGAADAAFGTEAVRLRPFVRDRLEAGCVLQTVLTMMGGDRSALAAARAPSRNTAVSLTAAKLMAHLNESCEAGRLVPAIPAPVAKAVEALAPDLAPPTGHSVFRFPRPLIEAVWRIEGPPFALPEGVREAAVARAEGDRAFLTERFGTDLDAMAGTQRLATVPREAFETYDADEVARLTAALRRAKRPRWWPFRPRDWARLDAEAAASAREALARRT